MRSRFCQTGGNDNKRGMSGNCLRLGVSAFLLIPVDINKMNRYHEKKSFKGCPCSNRCRNGRLWRLCQSDKGNDVGRDAGECGGAGDRGNYHRLLSCFVGRLSR